MVYSILYQKLVCLRPIGCGHNELPLSTEVSENRSSSFYVILLTNKLISADENITSLAEVENLCLWTADYFPVMRSVL